MAASPQEARVFAVRSVQRDDGVKTTMLRKVPDPRRCNEVWVPSRKVVSNGSIVELLSASSADNDFALVRCADDRTEGYLKSQYLREAPSVALRAVQRSDGIQTTRLRRFPDPRRDNDVWLPSRKRVRNGDSVELLSERCSGSVFSIVRTLDDRTEGYMHSEYLQGAPSCSMIPRSAPPTTSGAQRVHGLGQSKADLIGTYKPIRDFVKGFKPQKQVTQYIQDAMQHVVPEKASKFLPCTLQEVGKITQSLLETPTVRAELDKFRVEPMELFAMVLYSFDLSLTRPDDWDGDPHDNWYYVQNILLQERCVEKLEHMHGYLFFLMSGLQKLPDWEGELYRGIDETGVDIIQANYRAGRRIHFSSTSSATPELKVAKDFAGDKGVVLRMQVRHGRDIKFISALPEEQEVLLFPNIAFMVTKEFHHDGATECNVVDLFEADPESAFVF